MALRRLAPLLLLAALAISLVAAPSASAARNEVSIMDDQLLLNSSTAQLDSDMALFSALGVDRLRVSAFWNQIAPDTLSKTKPALGIKDPYELNSAQLHAAVTLLKQQRPLISGEEGAHWPTPCSVLGARITMRPSK